MKKLVSMTLVLLTGGLLSSCLTTIHTEPLPTHRSIIVHKKVVKPYYPRHKRVVVRRY
ncbi:MAG: hypothetical protein ACOH5I_20290 [Oligoflexus sp.]